jgi:hypothetical protein
MINYTGKQPPKEYITDPDFYKKHNTDPNFELAYAYKDGEKITKVFQSKPLDSDE